MYVILCQVVLGSVEGLFDLVLGRLWLHAQHLVEIRSSPYSHLTLVVAYPGGTLQVDRLT